MMLDGNQDQQICAQRNPDFRLYDVDRNAEEVLHRQVLIQPLEEQFNLPKVPLDCSNRQRRHAKQVVVEDQMPSFLRVTNRYSAQSSGWLVFDLGVANRII